MSELPKTTSFQRAFTILTLIIAGETVFLLPFVLARIFRPTFLDVFELTNLELGTAYSIYGIIAAISYFIGGPLADRFSARNLMAIAILLTSLGGAVFASIPTIGTIQILYAFWGCTTILLFWAALIRATREWGGETAQGRAYGLLDSGRGLFAALLGSISVGIFAWLIPGDIETISLAEKREAFSKIIWIFSGITLFSAILVFAFIPHTDNQVASQSSTFSSFKGIKTVLKIPAVWLQAIIIVCAYVGYKCTDDFSLYARDGFGYNDIEAAQVGTISFWVRPLSALVAGIIADKLKASRVLIAGFGLLIIGSLCIASGILQPGMDTTIIFTIIITSIAIYALRGLYFATFEEANIPLHLTGTAVGLVSVIGFTPDIFMGPLMGYVLDRSPGILGHQHLFAILAGFSALGLIASSLLFYRTSSLTPDI